MKKRRITIKKVLFIFVICLSFFSCLSFPSSNGYKSMPEQPVQYSVVTNSVEVSIDKVLDDDIANQILSICESYYPDLKKENPLILDVFVTQRSYFYDVSQRNSIFVNYTLTDSSNKTIIREDFSYETKKTVVSGREQYKIAKKIKKNIDKFLKAAQKV